jgi:phage gp46-like protein
MSKVIQDITIYESGDGGELVLISDDLGTNQSITNAVYLALFGGNVEQSTFGVNEDDELRNDWWGNLFFNDENGFNSEFEKTLSSVALNSSGVAILETAALTDLDFLKKYGNVTTNVSIDGVDKMSLFVNFIGFDEKQIKIKFIFDQLKNELIQEIII